MLLALPAIVGCEGAAADPEPSRRATADVLDCLERNDVEARRAGSDAIEVGSPGSGPRVEFLRTESAVSARKLDGRGEGAEPLGSALLYVREGRDPVLEVVEDCVTGVL